MYNPVSLEEWETYSTIDGQNSGINIKNSPSTIGGWYIYNNANSVRYVKLYNLETIPDPAQDIPKIVLAIPPSSGANVFTEKGMKFDKGLGIRICTGVLATDNTSPTANDIILNLFYK